ncbi:Dicer-like protein 1 [Mycoblastus sanguinarius]|nr:Dicer-like protein 1 [Mycoblastus sanguinarius]
MAYLKGLGPVEDATANTIPNTLTTQTGGSMEYEFAKLEVKHFVANTTTESSAVMGEADQYPSESESEDEQDVAKKTPKLSEKRRAQNMKFSAWLSHRTAKITKEEVQAVVDNANEETLSIRSLMAKQDSNVIITDPREYQLELFEKAKEQNIIAVLDTGQCAVNL